MLSVPWSPSRRSACQVALAIGLSLPPLGQLAGAQDVAAPASAPSDAAAVSQPLADLHAAVADFWHYGKIARYDLADAAGKKVLAMNADPAQVLGTFEAVAADHGDNLDEWMLRWQGVDSLKDTAGQLAAAQKQGFEARRADQNAIEENIRRLAAGERAYSLAVGRLRDSGELAVPLMVDYLRDANKAEYHAPIRRALVNLGKSVLNPLVAATDMHDPATLRTLIDVLADIGYDAPVPYLARLASAADRPEEVRSAAAAALQRMGATPQQMNPADGFYDLGEKLYYGKSAISIDASKSPVGYVWMWSEEKGLTKKDVPASIFNDVMALREAAYALAVGNPQGDAVSLWLAAAFRREVDLPAGAADPTLSPNSPPASFYGVQEGTKYLYAVLQRALHDNQPKVALGAIRSLQQIIGRPSLTNDQAQPLAQALQYPDRLVRFEAAFALAEALPTQQFAGSDRVVPLLAEAVSQNGTPGVIVLATSEDAVNKMVAQFKTMGYDAVGGTTAQQAVANANALSSVDVIVMGDDDAMSEVDRMFAFAEQSPRLERSAKLLMIKNAASPLAPRADADPLVATTMATDGDGLKKSLDQARDKAGAVPLDAKAATGYSLRAADLLQRLAINNAGGGPGALELSAAENGLLATLADQRADVAKAAGNVLAYLTDARTIQPALLARAVDPKTPDDVKISFFHSLGISAKFNGNQLIDADVGKLLKAIDSTSNVEVRTAAAEARGALTLPPEQAKKLILDQAKM